MTHSRTISIPWDASIIRSPPCCAHRVRDRRRSASAWGRNREKHACGKSSPRQDSVVFDALRKPPSISSMKPVPELIALPYPGGPQLHVHTLLWVMAEKRSATGTIRLYV